MQLNEPSIGNLSGNSGSSHSDEFVDVIFHRVRTSLGSVVSDDIAVLIDEELGEVPWDIGTSKVRLFLEVFPSSVSTVAIDLYFIHGLELDTISLLEIFDFFVGAWFLTSKLVAWIGNDFQTLFFVLLGQFNEALVVRISQSSSRCYVSDKRGFFATKIFEIDLLTINSNSRLVEEVFSAESVLGISIFIVGISIRRISEVGTRSECLNTADKLLEWTKEHHIWKVDSFSSFFTSSLSFAYELIPVAILHSNTDRSRAIINVVWFHVLLHHLSELLVQVVL